MSTSSPPGPPLPRARHEHLLRELELRGSIRASTIAAELGVTEVTVRRDIILLERSGHLARVHGGAISAEATTRPDPARSLIGLVLPGSGSHFPDVVRGAGDAATRLHARLMVASTNYRASTERRQIEQLVDVGVDGLVIAPTLRGRTREGLVDMLASIPVPLVLLERSLGGSSDLAAYDWVRTDHARGSLLALEHLVDHGHRRIVLALLDRTPTAPSIREGYARACAQLGLEPLPVRPLPKDDGGPEDPVDAALTDLLEECFSHAVHAVLVHTDHYAARLVEIAIDRGIRVPEDLSVIAYDDEFAQHGIVPLTAVAPPGREIGRLALQSLFDRLRAEDPTEMPPPRHVQVSPRLVARSSSAAPPRAPTGAAATG